MMSRFCMLLALHRGARHSPVARSAERRREGDNWFIHVHLASPPITPRSVIAIAIVTFDQRERYVTCSTTIR